MIANYHTHTWRCNHAADTERDYVEAAIARGIKTLGFADHSPYFFDGDYYSGFRMKREQYRDYVNTIRALRAEYEGRIDLLIGLEMEYYPKYFAQILDFCNGIGLDYIIMGQHGLDHTECWLAHTPTEDERMLAAYADRVLEGAETGVYTYIAHPDHFHFIGDEKIWNKHMRRMCEGLKELDVPLEMNMLGFREKRHYPRKDFFEIASDVGNRVVIGCDAHSKTQMADTETEEQAIAWLGDLGITPVSALKVIKPVLFR